MTADYVALAVLLHAIALTLVSISVIGRCRKVEQAVNRLVDAIDDLPLAANRLVDAIDDLPLAAEERVELVERK